MEIDPGTKSRTPSVEMKSTAQPKPYSLSNDCTHHGVRAGDQSTLSYTCDLSHLQDHKLMASFSNAFPGLW